ncbi:hypothetical protein ACLOJK_027418 [Asimina triloba]
MLARPFHRRFLSPTDSESSFVSRARFSALLHLGGEEGGLTTATGLDTGGSPTQWIQLSAKQTFFPAAVAPDSPTRWPEPLPFIATSKPSKLPERSGGTLSAYQLLPPSLSLSLSPFASFCFRVKRSFLSPLQVDVKGWLEAFAAHPQIGDASSSVRKTETSADNTAVMVAPLVVFEVVAGWWSKGEQSMALATATDSTLKEIYLWNGLYQQKFGFVFLICASGRSMPEILAELKKRYQNRPIVELEIASEEQIKIIELRLAKLFTAKGKASQHPVGLPEKPNGSGIEVQLEKWTGAQHAPSFSGRNSGEWVLQGSSVTDSDGRSGALMNIVNDVAPGIYRISFNTGKYSPAGFFPYVSIVFEVKETQTKEHFHVPLLLSPFSGAVYGAPPSSSKAAAMAVANQLHGRVRSGPIYGLDPLKMLSSTSLTQQPLAVDGDSSSRRRPSLRQTHRRRALRWPINAVYHVHNVELASDPLRPQGSVVDSREQRRTRLLHRRRDRCLLRSTTVFNLDGTITMVRFLWLEPMTPIQARTDSKMASIIFFSIIIWPSNHRCLVVVAGKHPIRPSAPPITTTTVLAATRVRPRRTRCACLVVVVVAVRFLCHRPLPPAATYIDHPLLQQVGNVSGRRRQRGTSLAAHTDDRPSLH